MPHPLVKAIRLLTTSNNRHDTGAAMVMAMIPPGLSSSGSYQIINVALHTMPIFN